MKSMQTRRRQVRRPGQAGFSLIELMVVVTILGIVAAIAVGAVRQDEFAGAYKRFVDDATGKVTEARNFAVDNQTQVAVTFHGDRVEMRTYDQVLNQWALAGAKRVGTVDGAILSENVCVLGLVSGVVPPAEAASLALIAPPANCLDPGVESGAPPADPDNAGGHQLRFHPDGSFSVETDGVLSVDHAGATLWIADKTVPAKTRLSMVQFFPGGLVRTFNDLD